MILITFLICGACQTVQIERYDLPPVPVRPQIAPLDKSTTSADIYNIMRDIMIYAEQWESWGAAVQELAGAQCQQ